MLSKKLAAIGGLILVFCMPLTVLCGEKELTKGELLDILLQTAPDYTPHISAEDIVSGYNEGDFRDDKLADDIEMLVMLSRAFPDMDEPTGENFVLMPNAAHIDGLPSWAQKHFDYLNQRGIISENTILDDSVTKSEIDMYLGRVWRYCAQSPRDDYYAFINRCDINEGSIKVNTSVLNDMQLENDNAVKQMIIDTVQKKAENARERKIGYIYGSALKMLDGGSVTPIKGYMSRLENAKNTKELMRAMLYCDRSIYSAGLFEFGLTADVDDPPHYIPYFDAYQPVFDYADYEDDKYKAAYTAYVKQLFMLAGDTSDTAQYKAEKLYMFEKDISFHCLTKADRKEPGKTYNKITFGTLCDLYDFADLPTFAKNAGLKLTRDDEIVVPDPGLVYNIAVMCREEPVTMKALAQLSILDEYGAYMTPRFGEASKRFWADIRSGTSQAAETDAAEITAALVSDYVKSEYGKKYLSESDKEAVIKMTKGLIKIYKQKIDSTDWMSAQTKKKAKRKLDTIKIKVGGEDADKFVIDDAKINSLSSLFKNYTEIKRVKRANNRYIQKNGISDESWAIPSYWANAAYIPLQNAIELPAGIIRAPYYSAENSSEENLGALGTTIAHELSHAFDNNGALCDENGRLNAWWTPDDYIKFSEKCTAIAQFYDGIEAAVDIKTDGMLTLGENISDIGGVSCALEAVKKADGSIEKFFTAYAASRKSLYERSYMENSAQYEEHANDRVRVNGALANIPDFAELYGVKEGNGMYTANTIGLW